MTLAQQGGLRLDQAPKDPRDPKVPRGPKALKVPRAPKGLRVALDLGQRIQP